MNNEPEMENQIEAESEVWTQLDTQQKETVIRMLTEMAYNFVVALSKDNAEEH
jgi:hypothetical protein